MFSLVRRNFHKSRKSYGAVPCGEADSPTPRLPSAAARSGVQLPQAGVEGPLLHRGQAGRGHAW